MVMIMKSHVTIFKKFFGLIFSCFVLFISIPYIQMHIYAWFMKRFQVSSLENITRLTLGRRKTNKLRLPDTFDRWRILSKLWFLSHSKGLSVIFSVIFKRKKEKMEKMLAAKWLLRNSYHPEGEMKYSYMLYYYCIKKLYKKDCTPLKWQLTSSEAPQTEWREPFDFQTRGPVFPMYQPAALFEENSGPLHTYPYH